MPLSDSITATLPFLPKTHFYSYAGWLCLARFGGSRSSCRMGSNIVGRKGQKGHKGRKGRRGVLCVVFVLNVLWCATPAEIQVKQPVAKLGIAVLKRNGSRTVGESAPWPIGKLPMGKTKRPMTKGHVPHEEIKTPHEQLKWGESGRRSADQMVAEPQHERNRAHLHHLGQGEFDGCRVDVPDQLPATASSR